MFDMFNNKKMKELEVDIRMLYKLYENLERHVKSDGIFESFCSNNYAQQLYAQQQEKYEDISIKSVVDLILKKMGLKVGYTPGRKVTEEISSEFKLYKRE